MTENRFLAGGIDTDSADYAIDNGMLLNAVNVRAVTQKGQDSGSIQYIDGNTEIASVTSFLDGVSGGGVPTRIGWCTNTNGDKLRLFYHFPTIDMIVSYDIVTDTVTKLIDSTQVTGGLGWTADTYISCEETPEGLLFFTHVGQEVRYINTNIDYSTIAPITQSQISLITEPPVVPLLISRDTDSGASTNIQFRPLQFTYRVTNTDNFVSVLAPYSATALPVRESELQSDANYGNVINVMIRLAQKIPANWKLLELVVRYLDTDTCYVVKQYWHDMETDVATINNHNNGLDALQYVWKGEELYALDPAYVAKQADAIPLKTNVLRLAASRLLLAGNTEGYNTPKSKPLITPTVTTFNITAPTVLATEKAYLLHCYETQSPSEPKPSYYALIIRKDNKNYLLPKEVGSCGYLNEVTANRQVGNGKVMWNLPQYIHVDYLIALKEDRDPKLTTTGEGNPNMGDVDELTRLIRKNIVEEANDIKIADEVIAWWCGEYQTFELVDDAPELGPDGKSRCFAPAIYKYGIRYYDYALRACSRLDCGEIAIGQYGVTNRQLTESITLAISNNGATPPAFSAYYALTFTKQQKAARAISFMPGLIKTALKDSDGNIHYLGYEQLEAVPDGYELYGIAIPYNTAGNPTYSFQEGDFVELTGSTGTTDTPQVTLKVRTFIEGNIICYFGGSVADMEYIMSSADDHITPTGYGTTLAWTLTNGGTKRQGYVFATLYTGQPDREHYEVAKFGPVESGLFGPLFDTGTLTATILGDHYTQVRKSATGAYTGFATTTYERHPSTIPISDLGRIALLDNIGQKTLPTSIRWSNTNIPGTDTNGYASFDPLDQKIVEQHSGAIRYIALTTKGIQEGGQLVILCENGSYVALIGKQQIVGADQNTAFIAQANVLGDINPLRGKWACRNPKSVVEYQGYVFWVDIVNKAVLQFSQAGAEPISKFKGARVWKQLLSNIADVSCGINPYTSELMVSLVVAEPIVKNFIDTFQGVPDHFNAWYPDNRTYIYNWQINKWVGSYNSGAEFFNVGDKVFSWRNGRLYTEFTGVAGVYYGNYQYGIIAVPFNKDYPIIKSPRSLRVVSNRKPDSTYIRTETGDITSIFSTQWLYREGSWMAPVNRNRKKPGANTEAEFARAAISGARLKGKVISVVLIWNAANGPITVSSLQLDSEPSGGQG